MTESSSSGASPILHNIQLFAATGSFTVCSMGMMVFNKLAVRVFPLSCTLVALQMLFTVLVMLTACWHTLHIGSFKDVVRWSVVIPFFVGMLLTSMFALKGAPMSLVITFRALSPWLTLLVERFFPNPTNVGPRSLLTMLLMVLGVALYTKDMQKNTNTSYAAIGWVALNAVLACIERLLQRLMLSKDQSPVDISKTGISLLNNLLGVMPLMIVGVLMQEPAQFTHVVASLKALDACWILLSCIVAVGISFCAIWAQSLISATSMLVLTNSNKFVVIILEIFVMPDKSNITPTQIFGAMLTIVATVLYAMARDFEEKQKRAEGECKPLIPKQP